MAPLQFVICFLNTNDVVETSPTERAIAAPDDPRVKQVGQPRLYRNSDWTRFPDGFPSEVFRRRTTPRITKYLTTSARRMRHYMTGGY